MAEKGKPSGGGGSKGPGYQVGKLYDVSGGSIKRKNPSCPKCGPGFFLAQHKNRISCGKCGYTEMKGK